MNYNEQPSPICLASAHVVDTLQPLVFCFQTAPNSAAGDPRCYKTSFLAEFKHTKHSKHFWSFSFQIEIVHPLNDSLIVQVSLTESIRCPQLFINNVDSPYLKWTLSQICFPAPDRRAGQDWTPPVRKMQLGLSALCWPWCEETAAFAHHHYNWDHWDSTDNLHSKSIIEQQC